VYPWPQVLLPGPCRARSGTIGEIFTRWAFEKRASKRCFICGRTLVLPPVPEECSWRNSRPPMSKNPDLRRF
jgi:hypothetical protein